MSSSALQRIRGDFRIKNPFSPRHFAELVVFVVVMFCVLIPVAMRLQTGIGVFLCLACWPAYRRYVLQRVAFGMTTEALVVDGLVVPWNLVKEIAVTGPGPTGTTTFAVRIEDAAPIEDLPKQLRSLRIGPDGFHRRHTVATSYDPAELRAALARFSPAEVTISTPGPSLLGDGAP